jgi:transposase-like protein
MRIKVCPQCGSKNIYAEDGGVLGEVYRCRDCGYTGAFIVEVDSEEYEEWLRENFSPGKD